MSDNREREIKALELEKKRIALHIEDYRSCIQLLQAKGMDITGKLCKLKEKEG